MTALIKDDAKYSAQCTVLRISESSLRLPFIYLSCSSELDLFSRKLLFSRFTRAAPDVLLEFPDFEQFLLLSPLIRLFHTCRVALANVETTN